MEAVAASEGMENCEGFLMAAARDVKPGVRPNEKLVCVCTGPATGAEPSDRNCSEGVTATDGCEPG